MGPTNTAAWIIVAAIVLCSVARCVRTRLLSAHGRALRDDPYAKEERMQLMTSWS